MIVAEELVHISSYKHCEGTKIGKVIKRSRSSIYKLADICATSGKDKAVKHVIDLLLKRAKLEKLQSSYYEGIPKLYYENTKDKFTITKQDLLNAIK